MPIKTKLLRILPYWFFAVVGVFCLEAAAGLLPKPDSPSTLPVVVDSAEPQVLGVATSFRGEPVDASISTAEAVTKPNLAKITAKSFLVFDLNTGQNLIEQNSKTKLGIASLTKLLTGFVAYEKSDLNQSFVVSGKDTSNIKPVLGLMPGDQVKALDIFNAMLIGSNNDAALALSNYVASSTGQNFIELMNDQAKTLGMKDSHFSNAIGFDSYYNYATVEDLKLLITETQKLAAFTNLGRRTAYDFMSDLNVRYHATATNKLILNHPDISAIKTGYTAGTQGAMATKVSFGNRQVVIIVLASQDREGDTLKLKNAIEENFKFN